MPNKWTPRSAIRNAVRHLRLAKSALTDDRLDSFRFDTALVSPLSDELYELEDVIDELASRSSNFHTAIMEDERHGR